jgi:hypothetical protein
MTDASNKLLQPSWMTGLHIDGRQHIKSTALFTAACAEILQCGAKLFQATTSLVSMGDDSNSGED